MEVWVCVLVASIPNHNTNNCNIYFLPLLGLSPLCVRRTPAAHQLWSCAAAAAFSINFVPDRVLHRKIIHTFSRHGFSRRK